MKLSKLKAGQLVETKGYYTASDDGAARYYIKTEAESTSDGDTIDGWGNHALASDTVAIIQHNGVAKLRSFGASSGDVTAAWQYIFSNYPSIEGHPDDTYVLSSMVTIPDNLGDLSYDFKGAELAPTGGFVALNMSETTKASATISTDLVRGSNEIHIDTLTTGFFEVGDLIQIRSDKLWYFDNRGQATKGETHIVSRVDGTRVYTESPIFDTYESATETLTVIAFNKTKLTLTELRYNNPLNTVGGIQLRALHNSKIQVDIDGAKDLGILLKNSYNSHVVQSNIKNSNESGFGYGVQVSQSSYCTVQSSSFWNCRRGVDFSGADGVCNFCGVTLSTCSGVDLDSSGNPLYGESSGFGSHGSSFGTYFAENTVYNVENAFILRGCKEIVTNNKAYGSMLSFIASTHGADLTVTDNNYESMQSVVNPATGDSRLLTFANITHADDRGRTVIRNNKANRVVTNFLQLSVDAGADFSNISGYDITGNEYNVQSNSSGASFTEIDVISGPITMKSCRLKSNMGASIFGGSIIKYHTDINISMGLTDSCIVEDFPLTLTATVGSPTGVIQTVRCSILEESVEVYGHLEFTTTGTATQFDGFPHPNLGPKQSFVMGAYGIGEAVFSYTGNTGNLGKYYISPTTTAPTGALSAGTYEIPINLKYNRKTMNYMG